ncbi:Gfo/Idh/MocA family protein [Thalassobium sp. R2A62]|uniref:Gfo/Idh/MocA family protein n=1 Tax=Thalassobium sp. R2A62 TaxID=633131 RepID=UPI0001B1CE68|nr:Gfo/Idh/MocA family oxidoreductase [Thalassobium sp. R2A62]EET47821.1 putative oxidoreductase [Thalassobium sp. R2A62]
MPVKWGILGASGFARQHMAPAIHAAEGAVLAGLATSSRDKAQPFRAFQPDLQRYDTYDALLADPEIEAVYIPLPNHLHVEWAKKAMAAGKHVLCEKPIALQASEIDELIALRDKTGLVATEAYMIVHHPQWKRVKHLVEDGAIGILMHVEGVFTYNNAGQDDNIRHDPFKGGGGIPDIGVYTYGATRWVTGQEPEMITQSDLTYENGVDVIARVAAQFDCFTAHWVNSMRMHPLQTMTFHGDQGAIRMTAPFNANVYDVARIEIHQQDLGLRVERFPSDNHYKLQVEAFCRSVRKGHALEWSLEDAQGTQAMIDAIYAKAKAG